MIKNNDIKKQGIKYLITGCWNTLFGIAVYAGLIKLFGERYYLPLVVLSNIISITNAYICYKIFVFKTKGNIFKEYVKCYTVYGVSMLCSIVLMYIFVDLFKINAIASNIVITLLLTIISFFGHKYFSFNKRF